MSAFISRLIEMGCHPDIARMIWKEKLDSVDRLMVIGSTYEDFDKFIDKFYNFSFFGKSRELSDWTREKLKKRTCKYVFVRGLKAGSTCNMPVAAPGNPHSKAHLFCKTCLKKTWAMY